MKIDKQADVIRLSLIDDHPVIFMGIRLSLKQTRTQAIEFANQYISGAEALADLENLNSDVVLIDMCLPDIKGYELAKKIQERYPTIKIGIFSSIIDKECVINSFKNGIMGYLPKSAGPNELLDFILTINRGERYVRGVIADILFENSFAASQQSMVTLTKRESEILQLTLDGLKNKSIASQLNISERTVEFHKQNIYLKLEVTNTIELYKAAQRLNLIVEKV